MHDLKHNSHLSSSGPGGTQPATLVDTPSTKTPHPKRSKMQEALQPTQVQADKGTKEDDLAGLPQSSLPEVAQGGTGVMSTPPGPVQVPVAALTPAQPGPPEKSPTPQTTISPTPRNLLGSLDSAGTPCKASLPKFTHMC